MCVCVCVGGGGAGGESFDSSSPFFHTALSEYSGADPRHFEGRGGGGVLKYRPINIFGSFIFIKKKKRYSAKIRCPPALNMRLIFTAVIKIQGKK